MRSRGRTYGTLAAGLVITALAPTGCSAPADGTGDVVVFAASSLTDVFTELESEYDGGDLRVNFGSSAQLVRQAAAGNGADVLVTADEQALEPLEGQDLIARREIVASNPVVLALAPGNPGGIKSLAGITRPGVKVAICAPSVPCGRAAGRVLHQAGIELRAASAEDNVRAVLTKVASGQVDAGLVYRTDALAGAGQNVTFVPLEDPSPNRYPAVLTTAGSRDEAATRFYNWLISPAGLQVLRDGGFGPPSGTVSPPDVGPSSGTVSPKDVGPSSGTVTPPDVSPSSGGSEQDG